ncbi:hypothetical protein OHA18_15800 [Kribbella sp. NBC_00709]|uniref:hypothetical protein n=1 Tax=Kribbella sp. NBC_00709 TaxID=2975972 RepID=UPI002E2C11A5|nr:hypothetical protein [Kribbella sp. NBC_00709]
MAEETWHQARLIPTSGISGADEQERRATSALLAVMSSVREFGRVLTQPMGAPAGQLETYIEVPFYLGERRLYPDGLLRARRGQKEWTALVEVKTGVNTLEAEQLEAYLDIAREQGFDALVTISNEIPAVAGLHPTKVDKRKLKRVALHHWSWSMVLAEAVLQKEHRGVADPDQAWILGELIRYLEHPRSGALQFDDMGPSWVTTREAVASGTLRPGDKCAPEVAARFDALLRYVSLQLGRKLGDDVTPALSRKELAEPELRSQSLVQSMSTQGTLHGAINIPNAVGPMVVTADLRAGAVTCHVDLAAPRDGRATTRVNWLLRQLRHAPDSTRLEAFVMHGRGAGTAELLRAVRDQPALLIEDPKKELRSFRIALGMPLGSKRGRGRGSFIDSVENAINTFYGDIVQDLRAWTAVPPRLREAPEQPEERPSLTSTALSSQDGTESGEAASGPTDESELSVTSDGLEEATEPLDQPSLATDRTENSVPSI